MAGRAVPGLPRLGPDEAVHLLRCLFQVAPGLPRPGRVPALQPGEPRQPRRALPPLPADRPHRGPRLDTGPGAGKAAPARVPPARSEPAPGVIADTAREPQGQAGPRRPRHRPAGDPASPAPAGAAGLTAPGRPSTGRPVRRPPRLELPERRGTGPAARAHPRGRRHHRRARPACPGRRLDQRLAQQRDQDPAGPAGLARSRRPGPRGRHQGTERPPQHHHPASPGVPPRAKHGHPRPRPAGHRRRAHDQPPHRHPPRRHRRRGPPVGEGSTRTRPPGAPGTPVLLGPQLPQLLLPGPGRLERARHQPARDHQGRRSGSARPASRRHGAQPAARLAQPVPGTQTGADHLPGPDPRDHPAGYAATARPDPFRPAPRADRPCWHPDRQGRHRHDRHPRGSARRRQPSC